MEKTYEITLPMDILWQDTDSEEYYADATESGFISELHDNLYKAGFENTEVSFSTVVTATINCFNEEGDEINHDDYDEIKAIIDNTQVIYLPIEQD